MEKRIYISNQRPILILFTECGMSVTNALKNSSSYGTGDKEFDEDYKEIKWRKLKIDDSDPKCKKRFDEFVEKTLNGQKKSYSNLIYYATGLWVTSYARRNVFLTALKIGSGKSKNGKFTDDQECYIDTDSIKFIGDHTNIFQEYNRNVIEKYKAVIKHYPEFTIDDFMPKDPSGIKHPIGFFEFDGIYKEAVFLGTKKYAYRDKKGLHITCAGVAKSGVKALKDDIRNFHKGFVFDYHHSGKLTHIYLDNQEPIDFIDYKGKKQHSEMKYGVVLQPTTYTVGITAEYEALFTSIQEELYRR